MTHKHTVARIEKKEKKRREKRQKYFHVTFLVCFRFLAQRQSQGEGSALLNIQCTSAARPASTFFVFHFFSLFYFWRIRFILAPLTWWTCPRAHSTFSRFEGLQIYRPIAHVIGSLFWWWVLKKKRRQSPKMLKNSFGWKSTPSVVINISVWTAREEFDMIRILIAVSSMALFDCHRKVANYEDSVTFVVYNSA